MESHVSDIVRSMAGRDAGQLMLVLREEGNFLFLADGKCRRTERPKRKKRCHVLYEGPSDARTRARLEVAGHLTNSEIRRALALWNGEDQ